MPQIDFKIKSRDLDTLIQIIHANDADADVDLVRKAYDYAYNAHHDQERLSGEPFIIHPLEVAIILANLKMDTTTIAAALLHDVVEDTEISLKELTRLFGDEVTQLVDGVTKISSLKKRTRHQEQAHSLRKMLLATIKDVRVIIVKLADKLHNMRTIMFHPPHKQRRIAEEVRDIYAPMAGRLGMSQIRSELEDLSFMVLHADEFEKISQNVKQRRNEIETYIEEIRDTIQQHLAELNINAQINGRVKHYYSIYRKIHYQGKTFDDIFDLRAIRIITDEIRDCYGILGIIHTLWTPIAGRFKDYIAVPKSNMYQSLHTSVIGPGGHPLEIQIRTWEMHATAEMGIAAHWLYKEGPAGVKNEYKNLTILQDINKWQTEVKDTREFMKELKMDLYEDEIFVFTPRGKIVKLAKGATPVDFAYMIHTEVGNHCIGAKVNNNMVPLKTELNSGDIVEIMTSKKGHPSQAWLKFVKSSNARYKIRNWLRKNTETHRDDEREDEQKEKKDQIQKTAEVTIPEQEMIKIKNYTNKKDAGVSIDGTSNVMIRLSQCCQPIPGDDVIGFITRGRGITIHKKTCPSIQKLKTQSERFIHVVWEGSESTYPVKLAVHGFDRPNLLKDVADEIGMAKTNILKAEAQVLAEDNALFKFVLEVRSVEHLNDIISRLKNLKNITEVYKINEKVVLK